MVLASPHERYRLCAFLEPPFIVPHKIDHIVDCRLSTIITINHTGMFQVTRVYSDSNGDTRFEDISIPLADAGEIGKLSQGFPVSSIIFREVEPSYDYDFHNAPQRQYLILIDGGVEIETTLGEKRQFQTGEVLLLEDTDGKGHRTRNLQPRKRKSVFVTLP